MKVALALAVALALPTLACAPPDRQVIVRIDPAVSPADAEEIQQGVASWLAVAPWLDLSFETAAADPTDDVVRFRTVASGGCWTSPGDVGDTSLREVCIDANWAPKIGKGCTVRRVAAHEFGHFLRLPHADRSSSIMRLRCSELSDPTDEDGRDLARAQGR